MSTPIEHLRLLLGDDVGHERSETLLKEANGDVGLAVAAFLGPNPSPRAIARVVHRSSAQAAPNARTEFVSLLTSSSSEDEDEPRSKKRCTGSKKAAAAAPVRAPAAAAAAAAASRALPPAPAALVPSTTNRLVATRDPVELAPLMDRAVLAAAKERCGAAPRAHLPLSEHRISSTGRLWVDDPDAVPRGSWAAPAVPLDGFVWPMLLGQVWVPLVHQVTRHDSTHKPAPAGASAASAAAEHTALVQQQLMAMALEWVQQGKLVAPGEGAEDTSPDDADGRLFWRLEHNDYTYTRKTGPAPSGLRLSLQVTSVDFYRAAAQKFPPGAVRDLEARPPYQWGKVVPCNTLRLCSTQPGGPLAQLELAHLRADTKGDMGFGQHPALAIRTQLTGPGLPPPAHRSGGGGGGKKAKPAAAASSARAPATEPYAVFMELLLRGPEALDEVYMGPNCSEGLRRVKTGHELRGGLLTAAVHVLLEHGTGLVVGPDCDGALNTGDMESPPSAKDGPRPGSAAAAAISQAAAGAGPSTSAASGPSSGAAAASAAAAAADAEAALYDHGEACVRHLDELLNSVQPPPGMPLAPVPAGVASQPKPFQLQGLHWLLDRERKGFSAGRSLLLLHPGWAQVVVASSGLVLHVSRTRPCGVTACFPIAPQAGNCGGLLCDEMGLGKSLQVLMLALAHTAPAEWLSVPRAQGPEDCPFAVKTTLLVTPRTLQAQWKGEIMRHVEPGKLSWGVWVDQPAAAGPKATRGLGQPRAARGSEVVAMGQRNRLVPLHSLDVLLVSYEQLVNPRVSAVLQRLGFWRLVLDEAQMVANTNSAAAKEASALWRRYGWVVTGTPINSHLSEMHGLCNFLAAHPFTGKDAWKQLVEAPYAQAVKGRDAPLRALLRGVMLRRTKAGVAEQLGLPPCTVEDVAVTLGTVERALYEEVKGRFAVSLEDFRDAMRRRDERAGAMCLAAQAALTKVRQSCCHPQLVSQEALWGRDPAAQVLPKKKGGKAAGGRAGGAAGEQAGGGAAAKGAPRMSMRQIMAKLVTEAYGEYDKAAAQLCTALLVHLAVQAAGKGTGKGAGGGKGTGGGGAGGGSGEPSSLEEALSGIVAVREVVSGLDALQQARVRNADGTVQRGGAQAAAGGAAGGPGREAAGAGGAKGGEPSTASLLADERRWRWLRLQLDCLMLRVAVTCSRAPLGAMALLAARHVDRTASQRAAAAAERLAARQAAAAAAAARHAAAAAKVEAGRAKREAREKERARKRRVKMGLGSQDGEEEDEEDGEGVEEVQGAGSAGAGGSGEGAQGRGHGSSSPAAKRLKRGDATPVRCSPRTNQRGSQPQQQPGSPQPRASPAQRASQLPRASPRGAGHPGQGGSQAQRQSQQPQETTQPPPQQQQQQPREHAVVDDELRSKELAAKHAADLERQAAAAAERTQLRAAAAAAARQAAEAAAAPGDAAAAAVIEVLAEDVQAVCRAMGMEEPLPLDVAPLGAEPGEQEEDADGGEGRGVRAPRPAPGRRAAADGSSDGDSDFDSEAVEEREEEGDEEGQPTRRASSRLQGAAQAGPRAGHAAPAAKAAPTAFRLPYRSEPVVRRYERLLRCAASAAKAASEVAAARSEVHDRYHKLQHLINRQEEQDGAGAAAGGGTAVAAAGGAGPSSSHGAGPSGSAAGGAGGSGNAAAGAAGAAGAGPSGSAQPGGGAPQPGGAAFCCPICLDDCPRRTVTACGHAFCSDCIHEIVGQRPTGAPCPICRQDLKTSDLMDSVSDALATALEASAAAAANAEHGAKVAALLEQLAALWGTDPRGKALVFSSWGRLLRFTREALDTNGVSSALMVGRPEERQAALDSFLKDPTCKVLLVLKSTTGGAAGLTLTVARTAFMMEPSMDPGLEAQAAARICRLGQDRPTRVVRLLAQGTVESRVMELQQYRQQHGGIAIQAAAGSRKGAEAGGEASTEAVDEGVLFKHFSGL